MQFQSILVESKLVLFKNDDVPASSMIERLLANIGVTEAAKVDLTGHGRASRELHRELTTHTGREELPYLFLEGEDLGPVSDLLDMVRNDSLQQRLIAAGIHALAKKQTPSLDYNVYGYPKGGLTERPEGRRNVLLGACGSSAADKIPTLVEQLVDAGHNVKLVPSRRAEHFFKDFGMQRILAKIRPSDIYRNDDEWSFSYSDFGMPARAAHLALCDWADVIIMAPVTCNTMGKIAHGVADNIHTSVFVAWPYPRKPAILCPACNTDMWNNTVTQENVAALRSLGVHIEGPRKGTLSNGRKGIGMMALPEQILGALDNAFAELDHKDRWIMEWAEAAIESGDPGDWQRIYRSVDEDVVEINVRHPETGDSLLHYAAGGEGKVGDHEVEQGKPTPDAVRELIKRGIDVNATNDFAFTSLHVAALNGSAEVVKLLLDAGADARACLRHIESEPVDETIKQLVSNAAGNVIRA